LLVVSTGSLLRFLVFCKLTKTDCVAGGKFWELETSHLYRLCITIKQQQI